MDLTHHSITAVVAEYYNVYGTGVICHTDSSFFGSIFSVVVANSGRESSSTDPVAHDMNPLTEPELHPAVWKQSNRRRSNYQPRKADAGQCDPKWGEDAVSHKDTKAIDQCQLQTDVLEVIVGASQ